MRVQSGAWLTGNVAVVAQWFSGGYSDKSMTLFHLLSTKQTEAARGHGVLPYQGVLVTKEFYY